MPKCGHVLRLRRGRCVCEGAPGHDGRHFYYYDSYRYEWDDQGNWLREFVPALRSYFG